jgi:hypothetical protein
MTLFCEKYLDEIAEYPEFHGFVWGLKCVFGIWSIWLVFGDASWYKVPPHHTLSRLREREARQCPANLTLRISQLKPPHQQDIECDARHDSQLASLGDRPRQPPSGDADAHPALNDDWELGLLAIDQATVRDVDQTTPPCNMNVL